MKMDNDKNLAKTFLPSIDGQITLWFFLGGELSVEFLDSFWRDMYIIKRIKISIGAPSLAKEETSLLKFYAWSLPKKERKKEKDLLQKIYMSICTPRERERERKKPKNWM